MKSKNNNKLVSSEKSEIKISNDKKTNVNVNTYMKKIKLLLSNIDYTSFHQLSFQSIMFEYFDIEFYDSKKTYDKNNTLLVDNKIIMI